MKFSCTVNLGIFSENRTGDALELYNAFGSLENLFDWLGINVDSVELHTVRVDTDLAELEKAVLTCREYGLACTYHGSLKKYTTPEKFFAPYVYLLDKGLENDFTVTLHPQDQYERIAEVLQEVCDYADERKFPVRFCLENQRVVNDRMTEGICTDVLEIVSRVHTDRLKICFDFGHRKSNAEKYGKEADVVPDAFFDRVAHTHIHSWYEGTTHFPLHAGKVELEKNLLNLFRRDYDGVLNLELCPARFCGLFDVREGFVRSVSILKTAAAQARAMLAVGEKLSRYREYAEPVFEKLETQDCMIGAIAPAAYVLRFGNIKIAVDPSMWETPPIEENRAWLIRKLADFDGVFVTHSHGDHYDPALLEELGKHVKCWVPDFMECANTIPYTDGEEIQLGELCVSAFSSCHTEPGRNFFPEYGLTLTYRGKTLVMPVDVRDYRADCFRGRKADILIAHLWLGRNALNLYDNRYIGEFCDFVRGFGASRVLIGHMDDARRKIDGIWTEVHLRAVQTEMPEAEALRFGEYRVLDMPLSE